MADRTITVTLTEKQARQWLEHRHSGIEFAINDAIRAALATPSQEEQPRCGGSGVLKAPGGHFDSSAVQCPGCIDCQPDLPVVPREHNCFDCGHPVSQHTGRGGDGCASCDCKRWFAVYPPEQPAVPEHVEEGDWRHSTFVDGDGRLCRLRTDGVAIRVRPAEKRLPVTYVPGLQLGPDALEATADSLESALHLEDEDGKPEPREHYVDLARNLLAALRLLPAPTKEGQG